MTTTRRNLLRLALSSAGLSWPLFRPARAAAQAKALPDATPAHLPRWRGFNLLNKFMVDHQSAFEERDFTDIVELGFDFVRLPLDYRCWTDAADPKVLKEPALKEIDRAVEYGRKHGVHVQLNFHRAPGFTVAKPPEAKSLWSDSDTQAICAHHW
jgi:endoglucanase